MLMSKPLEGASNHLIDESVRILKLGYPRGHSPPDPKVPRLESHLVAHFQQIPVRSRDDSLSRSCGGGDMGTLASGEVEQHLRWGGYPRFNPY